MVTRWLGMPQTAGMSLVGSQGSGGSGMVRMGGGVQAVTTPSGSHLPGLSSVPLALSGARILHFDLGSCFVPLSLSPAGKEG